MKKLNAKPSISYRKEITHTRIVETAARAIRRSGYDGTGVADIMKEAGLTHGGFYAHFGSRDEMLAEAADQAGAETIATAEHILNTAPEHQSLQLFIKTYLSNEHAANIDKGCFFAALCSEMPRQAPEVRNVSTRRIQEIIALVENCLSNQNQANTDQKTSREQALLLISTLVGTLMLARAVDDAELSADFRHAVLKCYTPEC